MEAGLNKRAPRWAAVFAALSLVAAGQAFAGGKLMLEEAAALAAGRLNAIASARTDAGEAAICLFPFRNAASAPETAPRQTQEAVERHLAAIQSVRLISSQSALDALHVFMPGASPDDLTDEQIEKLGSILSVDLIVYGTVSEANGMTTLDLDTAVMGAPVKRIKARFRLDAAGEAPTSPAPEPAAPETGFQPTPDAGAAVGMDAATRSVNVRLPAEAVLDFAPIRLDERGKRGLFMLSSDSLRVFEFKDAVTLTEIWMAPFKKKFARRGLTGFLRVEREDGGDGTDERILVALNRLTKPILYRWTGDGVKKNESMADPRLDRTPDGTSELFAAYGDYEDSTVVSFLGSKSYLVEKGADGISHKVGFTFPVDYYDGCFLKGDAGNSGLYLAILDEEGRIKIYQRSGKAVYQTNGRYGTPLICRPSQNPGEESLLFATTAKSRGDRVMAFRFRNEKLEKLWGSAPFEGVLSGFVLLSYGGREETEALALHESPGGVREMVLIKIPGLTGATNEKERVRGEGE